MQFHAWEEGYVKFKLGIQIFPCSGYPRLICGRLINRSSPITGLTAMLRAQVAADPGHPRAAEVAGALTVRSAGFAILPNLT